VPRDLTLPPLGEPAPSAGTAPGGRRAGDPGRKSAATRSLEFFGRLVLRICEDFGRGFLLFGDTVRGAIRPPYDLAGWFQQMVRIGFDSIPVVLTTAIFTGGVLALQTFKGFQRFHAEGWVGSVVALSTLRELAPVLTGLMVAGRAGSAIAAEIGSMRVTEQIDALVALATDPVQYLFVPRVLAGIVVLPILVAIADATGILGGYLVAVKVMGANPVVYLSNSFQYLVLNDLWSGLIKSAVFGGLLTLIACQRGYDTKGGAEGVGRSTTSAVVAGSLGVLISDFFLTKILF
jgi:phospholipid/cholesterol/gamma-HCH transport system permease protein